MYNIYIYVMYKRCLYKAMHLMRGVNCRCWLIDRRSMRFAAVCKRTVVSTQLFSSSSSSYSSSSSSSSSFSSSSSSSSSSSYFRLAPHGPKWNLEVAVCGWFMQYEQWRKCRHKCIVFSFKSIYGCNSGGFLSDVDYKNSIWLLWFH